MAAPFSDMAMTPPRVMPRYPLRLDANKTYLIDQAGRPFFMNGDTAWSLIAGLSREDAEIYLEDRRQRGFNLVLVNLIEHAFSANPPANHYGDIPFSRAGDFSAPVEAYFRHADWVIGRAADKGIVVLLAPLYLGYGCGQEGFCQEVKASPAEALRRYGRFLGQRYAGAPNLLWLIGGDADPVAQGVAGKVRELVAGIREVDTVHLMSAHNTREQAAMDPWPNEAWLDLNNIYTSKPAHEAAFAQLGRSPHKPFFLLETFYENEHGSTPQTLRAQAYFTVLSGGVLGHIFGNCQIWGFSRGFCKTPWKPELASVGSRTLALLGRLLGSRAFFDLIPDRAHQVLLSGIGSGATYAACARTRDGATVIAYLPTRREVTIDMSKISGSSARTYWVSPRSAEATLIGSFPTTGTRAFTPPDSEDWLLFLDDASRGLPPPGTSVWQAAR